jgi:hypothetical protein
MNETVEVYGVRVRGNDTPLPYMFSVRRDAEMFRRTHKYYHAEQLEVVKITVSPSLDQEESDLP